MSFQVNPILVKELRSRMRGWRAFTILTIYLLVMALICYLIYYVISADSNLSGDGRPLSPVIGQALWIAIAYLSLIFVAFITPALTATAISSEYEKQTIDMLQTSLLTSHDILFGKLISAMSYILMLLFAAIPIASLIFTFGGVTFGDFVLGVLIIFSTAIMLGMIGLFFSAWRKRTLQAIIFSYLTMLILMTGVYALSLISTLLLAAIEPNTDKLFSDSSYYTLFFIFAIVRMAFALNPLSALASVFASTSYGNIGQFFGGISLTLGLFDEQYEIYPLWYYTLFLYALSAIVLHLLANRSIQPIRTWRLGKRSIILAIAVCVILFALGYMINTEWNVMTSFICNEVIPTNDPSWCQ